MDLQTAQRLYEFRKANGFSQEELAEKIGVSRQAISKWERSESSPDTDNLIALARLYGITIDELINGSDAPKKTDAPAPEQAEAQETAEAAAPAEDKVDISLKNGINVDAANGDSVHIGLDGIKVNTANQGEINNEVINNAKKSNSLFNAIVGCGGFLLFMLTGFLCSGGWAYSWLFLLMIPVIITAVEANRAKNPSIFCYPLLMVVLYCGLGLTAHIWHPTWIFFITIPIYYIICDAYRKSKAPAQPAAQSANGTYFTPNAQGGVPVQEQGNKTARVILGIVLGLMIAAVIAVFGIIACYGIFSADLSSAVDDKNYSVGAGEVAADGIEGIEINWINGNVNIEYYDGNTISFSETEQSNSDYQLRYKVDNLNELEIEYCRDSIGRLNDFKLDRLSKDLTVYIPQGKELRELEINNVAAEVKINGVAIKELEIDSVSGNVNAAGSYGEVSIDSVSGNANISADGKLNKFSADSVSADVILNLPADTTGFKISCDSVSSKVDTGDFTNQSVSKISDGTLVYGDGHIIIGLDTVSGDFAIKALQVQ